MLTPLENLTYIVFGTLPRRVSYSAAHRAYVVAGQNGRFRNDLKKKRKDQQQKYKLMPRWEYILRQFLPNVGLPMELLRSMLDYVPLMSGLLGQGAEEDVDDDGGTDAEGEDDGGAEGDGDDAGDGGGDGGQDKPKKDSGGGYNFPSMPSWPSNPFSFPSLWDSGNKPGGNNGDQADGTDYQQKMKDVLNSDITKSLAKTGVSMLPGGQAALTAYDIGSKIAEDVNKNKGADDVMNDVVKDAVSSEAGQAAIKGLVGLLPGGDKIVKAMEAGDKMEDATKKIPGL